MRKDGKRRSGVVKERRGREKRSEARKERGGKGGRGDIWEEIG